MWQSRRYYDEAEVKQNAAVAFDRAFYPEGAPRQLAAIYTSGDRSEGLRRLGVPTLVIHGRDDTLITEDGDTRAAELVPGSRYLLVTDMGHDLPAPLWPALGRLDRRSRPPRRLTRTRTHDQWLDH